MRLRHLRPFLFCALLLFAVNAFARAGGGEHYSSGSSDSSSSGGSDSGDWSFLIEIFFRIIWFFFEETIQYPKVLLPIWAVLALVIYFVFRPIIRGVKFHLPVEVPTVASERPSSRVPGALAALKERDPSFDPDAFLARTDRVFVEVQEAWFLRNLDPVRKHMSDGVYRRFMTLLSLMRIDGQRDGLADIKVLSTGLLDVTRTAAFDCLAVRVHASLRDTDLDASASDDEARRKAQRAPVEEFTEIWTFVRRLDARTKAEGDVSQGRCPNCGAGFEGGNANKCEYCGAIVNSGNYDWVLTQITQPSEYASHQVSASGLEMLLARDPDAAAEVLEDRALLLFWKWLEARALSDVKPLRKLATADALAEIEPLFAGRKQRGVAPKIHNAAVGGTRILAVEAGVDGLDKVHTEIRWSAAIDSPDVDSFRNVLTMVRKSDAKTDRGVGLSNERCGECGAPLTDSDSSTCDYCGHDLTSADREWQFEDSVPAVDWHRARSAA